MKFAQGASFFSFKRAQSLLGLKKPLETKDFTDPGGGGELSLQSPPEYTPEWKVWVA